MLFDKRRFKADTDPEVILCLERMAMAAAGRGWDGPAKSGDAIYMAVWAQPDGLGAHNLYGGNPADPVNPFPLTVSASGSATVNWEEEGVLVLSSGTANFVGSGVTVTDVAGTATITITGGGGSTNAFGTIQVSGQSDVVADAAPDIVEFIGGTGITITTVSGANPTVTWAIDTSEVAQFAFKFIAVSGQTTVEADSSADTLTLIEGSNVTITTSGDSITIASAVDGVGYDEIQEEGTPLTKRASLNFIGERVTAADNAGTSATDVTFEYYIRVYGTTTTAVTAATPAFDVDGVSVIQGDMPELTAGELEITNSAKIPIDDETEAEFRWNQDAGAWQTEPLKSHMVMGLATAAVTGAAFSIDNIELVCGSDPRTEPSDAAETLSVENPFAWDIDDNGTVLAAKKANGDWIAIQAKCPA